MTNGAPERAAPELHSDDLDNHADSTSAVSPASRAAGRKTSRRNTRERTTLAKPVVIDRWSKNRSGDAITLTLKDYEGRSIFDLRTFRPGSDGKLWPDKGFACAAKHLPHLKKAISKALETAIELGLIEGEAEK